MNDRHESASLADDPIHVRATAAGRALIASFDGLDTDAELAAVRSGAMTILPKHRSAGTRWMAAVAAGALVVAGTAALVANSGTRRSTTDEPPPIMTPTPSTTQMSSTSTTEASVSGMTTTTAPTSTTITQPPAPSGPVAAVSYLDPPPFVAMTPLATVDVPDEQSGAFAVGIGDTGVVVTPWWWVADDDGRYPPTRLDVIDVDGRVRTVSTLVDGIVLAVGPGDVAYLSQATEPTPPSAAPNFSIVAVALSGDRAGEVIASSPANINEFLEYPPLSFGHGADGIVHRRSGFTDRPAFATHVDLSGNPVAGFEKPPTFEAAVSNGLGGVVTSSAGVSWELAVEPAPDRADNYVGASPPSPGAEGRGVYVTHLDNDASGSDFGMPSMWVVADLRPDGTASWWSLPDGWEIVASDAWGTIAARRDGARLELAVVDFTPA